MGRNKKGDRFLLNKTNLDRAFSRPNPDFHDTWLLVYLYATSSDKLSRRNILNAEAYAYRLRQIPEWQSTENLERMEKIDAVILRAKERLANRKTRKELQAEKETRSKPDGRRKKVVESPTGEIARPTAHLWGRKETSNGNANQERILPASDLGEVT